MYSHVQNIGVTKDHYTHDYGGQGGVKEEHLNMFISLHESNI